MIREMLAQWVRRVRKAWQALTGPLEPQGQQDQLAIKAIRVQWDQPVILGPLDRLALQVHKESREMPEKPAHKDQAGPLEPMVQSVRKVQQGRKVSKATPATRDRKGQPVRKGRKAK